MIYLDYAAATPTDEEVLAAMQPYFTDKFYNPSANYLAAKQIKEDIIQAKKTIAAELGVRHSEIIHTSGGTESNNLAITGVMDLYPDKQLLVSAVEHESILNPAKKYDAKLIPVNPNGLVDLGKLNMLINDDIVLISVMLANNEVGTVQPLAKVAEIIRQIRLDRQKRGIDLPLLLHTDACQAPCYMDVNVNRLGVDLLTLNGGKIYGPKGSGILFVKAGLQLVPQLLGGGQQRGLRSGTENPAGIIGFAQALKIASAKRSEEHTRIEALRQQFIEGLASKVPTAIINGSAKKHLPHIVSVTLPGIDNERLLYQLDEAEVLAAAGSACSASSDKPSHVLAAMGISDEQAQNSLRFSFGRMTTKRDIDQLLDLLEQLIA